MGGSDSKGHRNSNGKGDCENDSNSDSNGWRHGSVSSDSDGNSDGLQKWCETVPSGRLATGWATEFGRSGATGGLAVTHKKPSISNVR